MTGASPIGSLLTAMATAFDATGALDVARVARLARLLVDEGNDGVVVCGTTGESPALEHDEKLALFAAVADAVGEVARSVVAGVGSNNTKRDRRAGEGSAGVRRRRVAGRRAVLQQADAGRHAAALRRGRRSDARCRSSSTTSPGARARTCCPRRLLKLARRYPNIVGVKESSGDLAQITAIVRDRAPGFTVWSRRRLSLLARACDRRRRADQRRGARLRPRTSRDARRVSGAGDVARRGRHQRARLADSFAALFGTTSPIPLKWALRRWASPSASAARRSGSMPESLAIDLDPLLAPYVNARSRSRRPASLMEMRSRPRLPRRCASDPTKRVREIVGSRAWTRSRRSS